MLILTLQGFGQHEPLIWLDLHGCSFVEPGWWADIPVRYPYTAALGYRILRYRAGWVSHHAINPAIHEACGGAK